MVVSGPSGAGKSTAMNALEDLGFFCVDNLPVKMLPEFLSTLGESGKTENAAVVVDVRERDFLKDFPACFSKLKKDGYVAEFIFLEASDASLVKRFSETRRRHPLARYESPLEGITLERKMLKDIKDLADRVIDTTDYNVHELRDLLKEQLSGPVENEKISVNFISFGYRYGVPVDADLVIDVRFLPNPFFVDELKSLDGTDSAVKEFVLSNEDTKTFLAKFSDFISYLIPLYWKEGKSYLTIAVGCTGGKHRSVVIAGRLADVITRDEASLRTRHRDVDK